jgi:Spy/CpxP family protein refolding chaperone
MNKPMRLVAIFITVALVATAACYLSAKVYMLPGRSAVNDHEWIHKQLGLTLAEQKALEPIETKFEERKRELMGEIRNANKELAEAIKQDQADSPRVSTAVERIHHAQGELQEVTLGHVFEMKKVLKPEQYQELLNLTANELNKMSGGE